MKNVFHQVLHNILTVLLHSFWYEECQRRIPGKLAIRHVTLLQSISPPGKRNNMGEESPVDLWTFQWTPRITFQWTLQWTSQGTSQRTSHWTFQWTIGGEGKRNNLGEESPVDLWTVDTPDFISVGTSKDISEDISRDISEDISLDTSVDNRRRR